MKHASLDSQGRDEDCEIVSIALPNPEKKKQVGAASAGFLSLFTWQTRIGCYGNCLVNVEEKPKLLKRFLYAAGHVSFETAVKVHYLF